MSDRQLSLVLWTVLLLAALYVAIRLFSWVTSALKSMTVYDYQAGLFYRNGYFRQRLSLDGWQQEQFPTLDPYAMALTLCEGVRIRVDLAGEVLVKCLHGHMGSRPLLDQAGVGLGHIDDNSHRVEPGHGKHSGPTYGGLQVIAGVDRPASDNAIIRRADFGVMEQCS